MPAGALTVVGTGIEIGGHFTPQARVAWESAEEALFLVADPVAATLLTELNPRARSLHEHYRPGRPRLEAYEAMIGEMLSPLREGRSVCAAFYGHPGIFVFPGHEAVRRARQEGFEARLFPGISSLDCLWSDLGVDPALAGCQIYNASDFLHDRRTPDTQALLILLQISVIGQDSHTEQPDWSRLPSLIDYLRGFYPGEHEVIGYEASPYVVAQPNVERVRLLDLASAPLTSAMTLVVPPVGG
jgi:Tetrapyrrole (Corrin/Porphyrin) Methylases